ncbi:p91 capsid protein [Heliothis zea nudivirus]|uniref:p91 capsid protein n=1 Tax=Heliothis zea nudivirus 1 TaxID=3116536 RepID=Q8JKR5_9VIRU|nr:p91 capsid protein [Heliothis zea nudivirus]AAM45759.1 p91 capsid protein [Heliothis zea nudivirus]
MNLGMLVSLIALSVVCICTVILMWFSLHTLNATKIKTPRELADFISTHMKKNGTFTVAFTYRYNKDTNKYENYYVDSLGKLVRKYEDLPINNLGNPVDNGRVNNKRKARDDASGAKKRKGLIENVSDEGFTVTNIEGMFKCPDNWIWRDSEKMCKPKAICQVDDPIGTIKGLPTKDASSPTLYHPRVYAVCQGPTTEPVVVDDADYEFRDQLTSNPKVKIKTGRCINNKVYNQKLVNRAGSDPCVFYDVCQNKEDGYTHADKINDYTPSEYEYYSCHNSTSILKSCKAGLIYSKILKTCTFRNLCNDKPNTFTLKIDDTRFLKCINYSEAIVSCRDGIYTHPDGRMECVSLACKALYDSNPEHHFRALEIQDYRYMSYVSAIEKCIDNKIHKIATGNRSVTYALETRSGEYYTVTRKRLTDDPIRVPGSIIDKTGQMVTVGTLEALRLLADQLIVTNPITIRYNYASPWLEYDLFKGRPFNVKKWNRVADVDNPVSVSVSDTDKAIVFSEYYENIETKQRVPFKSAMTFYSTNRPYFFKDPDEDLVHKELAPDGHVLWAMFRRKRSQPLDMYSLSNLLTTKGAFYVTEEFINTGIVRMVEGLPFDGKLIKNGTVIEFKVFMNDRYYNVTVPIASSQQLKQFLVTPSVVQPGSFKTIEYDESKFDYDTYRYFIVTNIMFTQETFVEHAFSAESVPCVSFFISLLPLSIMGWLGDVKDFDYRSFFTQDPPIGGRERRQNMDTVAPQIVELVLPPTLEEVDESIDTDEVVDDALRRRKSRIVDSSEIAEFDKLYKYTRMVLDSGKELKRPDEDYDAFVAALPSRIMEKLEREGQ